MLVAELDAMCGRGGLQARPPAIGREFPWAELPAALAAGKVAEADLDRALVRLTKLQMELGLFDPKEDQRYFQFGLELINSAEHVRHALEAAQQSIDTLQRIIDDKNEQLRRKDHLIDSLRK